MFDILTQYAPYAHALYGADGIASASLAQPEFHPGRCVWSVLRLLPDGGGVPLLAVWAAAAVALAVGWHPRIAAAACWALAVSYAYAIPGIHSGGDRLRSVALFALVFCPSGAAWSVRSVRERVAVSGWPVRLILVHLAAVYVVTGLHKYDHPGWRDGTAMYYVANNLSWSTAAGAASAVPLWAFQLMSWGTLGWQIAFPVLAALPTTRPWMLAVGASFHVVSIVALDVGMFSPYALFCYLPFVPWERLRPCRVSVGA